MTDVRHPIPELMRENDVIDLLVHQHSMIRDMFDEVAEAPDDGRAEAFRRLVRMLAVHETAEEEIVHPYARRKLASPPSPSLRRMTTASGSSAPRWNTTSVQLADGGTSTSTGTLNSRTATPLCGARSSGLIGRYRAKVTHR